MADTVNFKISFQELNNHLVNINIMMLNIMTLGKRHSKEHFADVLDDLKKSFSTGKSHAATQI